MPPLRLQTDAAGSNNTPADYENRNEPPVTVPKKKLNNPKPVLPAGSVRTDSVRAGSGSTRSSGQQDCGKGDRRWGSPQRVGNPESEILMRLSQDCSADWMPATDRGFEHIEELEDLMVAQKLDFAQARYELLQLQFQKFGIGEDGIPLDPKLVTFGEKARRLPAEVRREIRRIVRRFEGGSLPENRVDVSYLSTRPALRRREKRVNFFFFAVGLVVTVLLVLILYFLDELPEKGVLWSVEQ